MVGPAQAGVKTTSIALWSSLCSIFGAVLGKKQTLVTHVISMATSMDIYIDTIYLHTYTHLYTHTHFCEFRTETESFLLVGFTQWRGVSFEWFPLGCFLEAS